MAASALSAAAFWARAGETVARAAAASAAQPTRDRPWKVICFLPLWFVCWAEFLSRPLQGVLVSKPPFWRQSLIGSVVRDGWHDRRNYRRHETAALRAA